MFHGVRFVIVMVWRKKGVPPFFLIVLQTHLIDVVDILLVQWFEIACVTVSNAFVCHLRQRSVADAEFGKGSGLSDGAEEVAEFVDAS